jgi:hypothetical protein
MGKKSRSGSGKSIPDHISESLETLFWVKKLKFFYKDRDPGLKKFTYAIRDKHPGSATMKVIILEF